MFNIREDMWNMINKHKSKGKEWKLSNGKVKEREVMGSKVKGNI